MKTVTFKEIGMENFKSYIDPMVIKIIPGTITLLVGPNGIGKTSIFDSIPFSFYGMTYKGARGDDVVNNRIGKNCHTWVHFDVNDTPYRVERYHKHSKHGNTVLLIKDDKVIRKGHREVKPELERLLIPQKLFFNTMMFGQNSKTFFTDLQDSEQKEIFRKVMKLDDYVVFQKEASEKESMAKGLITDLNNQISVNERLLRDYSGQEQYQTILKKQFKKNKEEEIAKLEGIRNHLMQELTNFNKESDKFDLEKLNKLKSEKDHTIYETKEKLNQIDDKLKTQIAVINNEAKEKELELKEKASVKKNEVCESNQKILSEKIDPHLKKLEELKRDEKEANDQYLKVERYIENIISKKNLLVDQENKLQESISVNGSGICPTCGTELTKDSSQEIQKHIYEINAQLSKLADDEVILKRKSVDLSIKCTDTQGEIKSINEEIASETKQAKLDEEENLILIESQLKEVLKRLEQFRLSRISTENKETFELRRKLESLLESMSLELEEIEKLLSEANEIVSHTNKIASDLKQAEYELASAQKVTFDEMPLKEIQAKKKVISKDLQLDKLTLKDLEESIDLLMFWKEGFSSSGIPSMLIDEAIPFMNNTISSYLDKIGGRYTVSFDTMKATKSGEFRDKISVNLFDSVTWANERVQFSGGQVRVVDIATILTLSDLQENIQNTKFNILLFDEIFDSLDDQNTEYVSALLSTIKRDRAIFIVSHKHIHQIEADETYNLQ